MGAHRQGAAVLSNHGHAVEFGSSSRSRVRLVNAEGETYTHISSRAGRLALFDGVVYLENLSQTHGLVYRRWGFGEANDTEIPAGLHGHAARRALGDGLWWVRNGKARTQTLQLQHPRNEDSCWLLFEVMSSGEPIPAPQGISTGTGDLAISPPVVHTRVELTPPHLTTIAHIFREFLSLRPCVSPRPLTDATLRNLTQRSFSQRRSEVRRVATDGGYPGTWVDEGMLAWFLNREHLTYRMLLAEPEAAGALGLVALG
ncbi:hypothetical protein [Microbacterium sp. Gd 4-13]|uniref:hypothetical protein n=1 Tax=Microbacterium sp. Gd 4-13 TaxID=2173179 RepID=UPI001057B835|nr:hypothetical protein [Microbacterium sp. Gd 4-13]